MINNNQQKIKLLKLMELLRQETDELHPLSTKEICNRLSIMGISCERRTLAKDISLLNEQGYEVMWCRVGKEKGYYIAARSFSVPELKMLIDAVQAANFITEKKSAELIDKIAALGGSHQADILQSNLVCFNTRNTAMKRFTTVWAIWRMRSNSKTRCCSVISIWMNTVKKFIAVRGIVTL